MSKRIHSSGSNRKSGLLYFIQEGFRGVISHKFMSFAAVTVIAACLLVTATFSLVAYNIGQVVQGLESQSEIIIYINDTVSREDAEAMGEQILTVNNVKEIQFVTKEEMFQEYLDSLGDEAYVMEDLLGDNPLRDSYRVTMKDINLHAQTVEQLEQLEGVGASSSSKEVSDRLIQIRRVTDLISFTLVAMLGAVSVFIIANTVKLAMFARRDEIGIMKMVGATNHFIRAPFVVEGVLLGVCAAFLAYFAQWGVYDYIGTQLAAGTGVLTLLPFQAFSMRLLLILLAAGMVFGIGGSTITIRKFMKV